MGVQLRADIQAKTTSIVKDSTLNSIATLTRNSRGFSWDSTGNLVASAANVPRFQNDITTLKGLGLLLEVARTNLHKNPSLNAAVAGTPGTLPTGYNASHASTTYGVTRYIEQVGTENGIPFMVLRFSGTPTTTGTYNLSGDATTAIAAVQGETHTWSAFVTGETVSGATLSTINVQWGEFDSSGALVGPYYTTPMAIGSGSLKLNRLTNTRTISGSGVAYARPLLFANFTNGVAFDHRIKVGGWQQEKSPYASTPIYPASGVTAATTRAADILTYSPRSIAPNGETSVTAFTLSSGTDTLSNAIIFKQANSDNTTYMQAYLNRNVSGGLNLVLEVKVAGTTTGSVTIGVAVVGANKLAVSLTGNTVLLSLNGAAAVTLDASKVPHISTLTTYTAQNFPGYLTDLRVISQASTAAQLQRYSK